MMYANSSEGDAVLDFEAAKIGLFVCVVHQSG